MKLNEHGVGPEQQPETERCLQSTRASINCNMTSKRREFNGKNTSVCLSLCLNCAMILRGKKDTSFRVLIEQTKALADAAAKKM